MAATGPWPSVWFLTHGRHACSLAPELHLVVKPYSLTLTERRLSRSGLQQPDCTGPILDAIPNCFFITCCSLSQVAKLRRPFREEDYSPSGAEEVAITDDIPMHERDDLGTVERPTRAFLLQEYEASRKLEVRQERTAFLKAVSNILAQSTIQDCSNPELEVSVRGLMRLASSFRYASLLTVTVTVRPVMVPSGGSCFVTVSPCRLQPTRFYAEHGHEFPIATAVYKRFMSTQVTTVRLEVSGGVCFFTICSAES
jgi:hypothetical protein